MLRIVISLFSLLALPLVCQARSAAAYQPPVELDQKRQHRDGSESRSAVSVGDVLKNHKSGLAVDEEYWKEKGGFLLDETPRNKLDLKHKKITSLEGIPRSSQYSTIDLSHNHIQAITKQELQPINKKHLQAEEINLSHNKIAFIENDAFAQVYIGSEMGAGTLDLSHNELAAVTPGMLKTGDNTLKSLNLAHNKIASVANGSFSQHKDLEELDLRGNKLDKVPADLHLCKKLKTLNLDGNPLVDKERQKYNTLKHQLETKNRTWGDKSQRSPGQGAGPG